MKNNLNIISLLCSDSKKNNFTLFDTILIENEQKNISFYINYFISYISNKNGIIVPIFNYYNNDDLQKPKNFLIMDKLEFGDDCSKIDSIVLTGSCLKNMTINSYIEKFPLLNEGIYELEVYAAYNNCDDFESIIKILDENNPNKIKKYFKERKGEFFKCTSTFSVEFHKS